MSEYEFKLPDLGEGLIEAEIAEWMVKPGDTVEEEDVICAVMTDKAAVELSAPVNGKVVSVGGEPGDMVAVGSTLIVFETRDEQTDAASQAASVVAEPVKQQAPQASAPAEQIEATEQTSSKVLTSPSIRRLAREAGIDLSQLAGSGPRGRILRSDLDVLTRVQTPTPPDSITEIKVVGLRRMIAERMTEANNEIPHFGYVEEIDVTALESLRKHLNSKKTAAEDKLTLLPFIGLALARALKDYPQCNAHYDKQRNVISQFAAVHLGIATQTPSGLKVPVVRHSESIGLNELAAEIRRLSSAARDNTARREDLSGSTITITSLGKAGGIVTTPIINLPEVGIIGVNKAIERPVVVDGKMVIRTMMNLSSSFDHRFVDGFDAAMMIQQVKDFLEQPATIFID